MKNPACTMGFDEQTTQLMDKLSKQIGVEDRSHVIRAALALLDAAVEVRESPVHRLYLLNKTGDREREVLLGGGD